MKILPKKLVIWFLATSFLVMGISSVFATKMLHRNVEELATLADRVFVGVCISAEEKQMDFPSVGSTGTYTEYTFQVEESIKGVTGGTVVLRQVGRARGVGSIVGMPAYESDKKYVMFLREDSQFGLASPIGLGQGCFAVFQGDGVKEMVMNGFNNSGLFNGMDPDSPDYADMTEKEKGLMAATRGPLDFDTFVGMVTKLSD